MASRSGSSRSLTRSSTTSTVTLMSCRVCVRLTDRKQFPRGGAEDIRGDPRSGRRVVEPVDERRDPGLGDQADGGASPGRHVPVPRQGVVEPFEGGCGELAGDGLQPGERLFFRFLWHECSGGCAAQLSPPAEPVVPASMSCSAYFSIACCGSSRVYFARATSDSSARTTSDGAVDLEEAAGGGAGVGEAEVVGAERGVVAGHELPDLVRHGVHVVASRQRTAPAPRRALR